MNSLFGYLINPAYAADGGEGGGGGTWGDTSRSLIYLDPLKNKFSDTGAIINELLSPLLVIAGLILFGMIIMGGFEMLTAASDAKKAESGKGRITSAIIGFIIIFCAYWIVQILEIVLGVKILSN